MSSTPTKRRPWQRATVSPPDRRALERAGWRTTLEYRENHIRRMDGTLVAVEAHWVAEAEWHDGQVVASATATTVEEAWARLRQAARAAVTRPGAPATSAPWCRAAGRPVRAIG